MALVVSSCSHSPTTPWRGMRAVEMNDSTIKLRCPACGLEHDAMRCVGVRSDGERCRAFAFARAGYTTCLRHRSQELAR